jgi:hypothetical protein
MAEDFRDRIMSKYYPDLSGDDLPCPPLAQSYRPKNSDLEDVVSLEVRGLSAAIVAHGRDKTPENVPHAVVNSNGAAIIR